MSDSLRFHFTFAGPALDAHRMDVRELSQTLTALADLLNEANRVISPEAPPVKLEMEGRVKAGSIWADLVASYLPVPPIPPGQIVFAFVGKKIADINEVLSLVINSGIVGGGLIAIYRKLRGQKPNRIEYKDEKKAVIVYTPTDNATEQIIEVAANAAKLYQSSVSRRTLEKMLIPLEREGIDSFSIGRDGKTEAIVRSEEYAFFKEVVPDKGAPVSDSDTVSQGVWLEIESPSFKEGNKWRFLDGENPITAKVEDEAFLERVDSGEPFAKQDVLLVDLRREQSFADNKLKTRYSVTRVHDHRQMPRQTKPDKAKRSNPQAELPLSG